MQTLEVSFNPYIADRKPLKRHWLTQKIYFGNPKKDVIGFRIQDSTVAEQLEEYNLFYGVMGTFFHEWPVTEGEVALGCDTCPVFTEAGLRPYIDLRRGLIACLGLAALNRYSDDRLRCLRKLGNQSTMKLTIPINEGAK